MLNAEASVDRLIGNIAHDLNNLLTVIGGNLELLDRALAAPALDAALATKAVANATRGVYRAKSIAQRLIAVARGPAPDPSRSGSAIAAPAPRSVGDGAKPTILVVEDEPMIGALLTDYLDELGLDVMLTGSIAEASDRLDEFGDTIAGALVDLGLPDGDGAAFAQRLRQDRPLWPLVISTGQGERGTLQRLPGAGTEFALLTKPYTIAQLRTALALAGLIGAAEDATGRPPSAAGPSS